MRLLCVAEASWQQLGNRLFLYAHLIACSLEYGLTVVNPFIGPHADRFTGTAEDLLCRYPGRRSWFRPSAARRARLLRWAAVARPHLERWANAPLLSRWICVLESGRTTTLTDPQGEYDLDGPAFREAITTKRLLLIKGALHRAHRSIRKHGDAVREHLRPLPDVAGDVSRVMAHVRARGDVVVGVHVRQGDYRGFAGGKYFFTTDQYRDLMMRVTPQLGGEKVVFLVCSNQAVEPAAFGGLRVVVGGGDPLVDLYAMARCDFIIGPPSTFSGWSAFYGRVPRYRILEIDHSPSERDFVPVES